jgi:hypothetical protein
MWTRTACLQPGMLTLTFHTFRVTYETLVAD